MFLFVNLGVEFMYHYSHLEDYIKQFYIRLGINHPTLLNLKTIEKRYKSFLLV